MRPPPDILIAEDELLLREALQDALEASGHRVAVARNGQEALRLLDRLGRPALIVLDLQMPIMDGVTFLAELRKRHDFTDFHVLAMSAVVNEQWLERVPGVLRTLQKPFDVKEIIDLADAFASGLPSSRKPPAPSEQATPAHRPDPSAPDVPPEQSSAIRRPPGHEAGNAE
jgi:two-component system, chemotaxis family, chemotaxis protein CheY